MIDIFMSRGGCYRECKYWRREAKYYGDNNKIVHTTSPSGVFYAKIMKDNSKNLQEYANVFQYNSQRLNILTRDVVNIAPNDLIEMNNEIYIVISVAERIVEKNSQFSNTPSKQTLIGLKK